MSKKQWWIILAAIFLFLAGCGKNQESKVDVDIKEEKGKITVSNNDEEVVITTEQSEDGEIVVMENADGGKITIGSEEDVIALLPDDFPFPKDYQLVVEQSMTVKDDKVTSVQVAFLTNEEPTQIINTYNEFISTKYKDFSITEMKEPPTIIAVSDKGLISVLIENDHGFEGFSNLIIFSHLDESE